MDLRIVKTKKAIREAFLALRREYALDQVKVKDLCDRAIINKTTFYKHYDDIYALEKELEEEAINKVMAAFSEKMDLFVHPQQFIRGLPVALEENRWMLEPLFHHQLDHFFSLLEKKLIDCYQVAKGDDSQSILLIFAIGGTLHTLRAMKYEFNLDDELLSHEVSQIIEKLGNHRQGSLV